MVFFFKQKTAYEMRISDWSSDVCSSDLPVEPAIERFALQAQLLREQPEPAVEVGAPQYVERVEIRILALCILVVAIGGDRGQRRAGEIPAELARHAPILGVRPIVAAGGDRKSTRLNYSH